VRERKKREMLLKKSIKADKLRKRAQAAEKLVEQLKRESAPNIRPPVLYCQYNGITFFHPRGTIHQSNVSPPLGLVGKIILPLTGPPSRTRARREKREAMTLQAIAMRDGKTKVKKTTTAARKTRARTARAEPTVPGGTKTRREDEESPADDEGVGYWEEPQQDAVRRRISVAVAPSQI